MGKGSRTRLSHDSEQVNANQGKASGKSSGKMLRNVAIILLVLAFAGVGIFGLLSKTGFLMGKLAAYDVGDQEISALEYRIYYKDAEINLITNYGSTLEMYYGVDFTQPLESQAYGDGTWGDFLHESAKASLLETYSLYGEALENGYTLVDENDPTYLGIMAKHNAMAREYEMDLDEYIKNVYGSAVSLDDLQQSAKIYATATNYYNDYIDSIEVTEQEISDYYAEKSASFDLFTYRSYAFDYETVSYTEPTEGEEPEEGAPASQEEADALTEANIADAQAKADEFIEKVNAGADFAAVAEEYDAQNESEDTSADETEDPTLTTDAVLSSSSDIDLWLAEDGRTEGEMTTIDTGSSITVVCYVSRRLPEIPTATVRHILLTVDSVSDDATDEEKELSEQSDADAKAKIEEIYDEWKSGDMTEDSFALLAMEYSEDLGSVSTGGLIEDFSEGNMVAEFDEWCFDESRQPGDTEIVKSSYGYHLIYYVSPGDSEWRHTIISQLKLDSYNEYYETLTEKYPVTDHEYGQSLAY